MATENGLRQRAVSQELFLKSALLPSQGMEGAHVTAGGLGEGCSFLTCFLGYFVSTVHLPTIAFLGILKFLDTQKNSHKGS